MVAFLIAGVILAVLARVLRRGPGTPSPLLTVLVCVVGAVVGGVGMNLLLSDPWSGLTAWSFTAACLLPFVLLGLLEGGVGRR
jgi:uncharacterized membrane protein YeaQ/YmgE (transglycosylase-associated protein family)